MNDQELKFKQKQATQLLKNAMSVFVSQLEDRKLEELALCQDKINKIVSNIRLLNNEIYDIQCDAVKILSK